MEDSPSFSLGITQVFADIARFLAKARDFVERRFKIRHDSIPLRLSSMNKKKAVEIFANSGESEEEKVYESDKPEENDSEKGNKVCFF